MSSVVNYSKVLRYADDRYRGRVFATMETMTWTTMMVSLFVAGIATETVDPRTIGVVAGVLSGSTGIVWAWANWAGKLKLPESKS